MDNKNKINNIVDNLLDNLGENVNNQIFDTFGHSISIEELERLHEIIYNKLLKQI
tara:strand:+ start:533 stop:697 length:165 start_codon:yes stop_codon:yes gene_type:complete